MNLETVLSSILMNYPIKTVSQHFFLLSYLSLQHIFLTYIRVPSLKFYSVLTTFEKR